MLHLTRHELELALFALNNYARNPQPKVYCLPENVADKQITCHVFDFVTIEGAGC